MKSKLLCLLLVLATLLTVTGCSTGGESSVTSDPYESEPTTDSKPTAGSEFTSASSVPDPDYSKITISSASDSALQKIANNKQITHLDNKYEDLTLDGTEVQQIESYILSNCIYADAVARAICDVKLYSGQTIGELNPWLAEFISHNDASLDNPDVGWTTYLEWRDDAHTDLYLNSSYYDYVAKLITLLENLDHRIADKQEFSKSLSFYITSDDVASFRRGKIDTHAGNRRTVAFELCDGVWTQPIFAISTSEALIGRYSVPIRWAKAGDYFTANYDTPIGDGYFVRYIINCSAWIDTKDIAALESAWDYFDVGFKKDIPSSTEPSHWGLTRDSSGSYRTKFEGNGTVHNASVGISGGITDSYFIIGNISVQNITPGWDFSAENSRTTSIELYVEEYSPSKFFTTLGEVYFSDHTVMMDGFAHCNPSMDDNHWGPRPFVLVQFDVASPNYPNGRYAATRELSLKLNGYDLFIPN